MATARYKVLDQVSPTTTGVTAAYTVPGGKDAIVSTLVLCNIHTAAITVDWHVRPGGATLANKHYQAKGLVLNVGETEFLTLGLTPTGTDVISVTCSVANGLAVTVYGTEITYP